MRDIDKIDFYDFNFNGHYLSEFGGIVADNEGGKITYSLLPEREYVINHPFECDSTFVFKSRLKPRIWEVPIFFNDLDYAGIRKIAGWLNSPTTSQFFYKGDSLMINARINSEAINLGTYSGQEGLTKLQFIAHDPYYYDIYTGEKFI